MNLEQRVEILEQEVQVLKSQIQATLLEIQEFVLTNSFSMLRAEEPATSHHKTPLPEEQPAKPGVVQVPDQPTHSPNENNAGIHRQILAAPQNSTHDGGSEPQIRVNKLGSVDEITHRDLHREAARYADMDRPRSSHQDRNPAHTNDDYHFSDTPRHPTPAYRSPDYAESDWNDYSRQADPSGYEYTTPGRYAAVIDDFDDDFDDEDTSVLNQWAPPFFTEPLDNDHNLISDADWANLYLLETWVRKRMRAVGPRMTQLVINHYVDVGRFNPAMGAMLLQIASIVTDQDVAPAFNEKHEPVEKPPAFTADEPTDPITHNTILKMIARLQTMSVSRRNGNG